MEVVRVGEVEDRLLELADLVVHLVLLDVGLELGEVVHSALSVGGGDHVCWVLPDVLCDLAPCCLDGCDGVGEGTVLEKESAVSNLVLQPEDVEYTYHVKEDGVSVERSLGGGRHVGWRSS